MFHDTKNDVYLSAFSALLKAKKLKGRLESIFAFKQDILTSSESSKVVAENRTEAHKMLNRRAIRIAILFSILFVVTSSGQGIAGKVPAFRSLHPLHTHYGVLA